jgi:FkbM family methyltransferase
MLPERAVHWTRRVRWRLAPQEPEAPTVRRILRCTRGLAIDVGANYGFYTSLMAACADEVVAFEANPAIAGYLARVSPGNVRVENLALSNDKGIVRLRIPEVSGSQSPGMATVSTRNDFATEKVTGFAFVDVAATTLDHYVADRRIEAISFLKIDVEGHESEVLDGAWQSITRFMPVMLVESEYRHGADVEALVERLRRIGYEAFITDEQGRVMRPLAVGETRSLQQGEFPMHSPVAGRASIYRNNFLFVPASMASSRMAHILSGK